MNGITEKSNSGLFENEIELNGKYATYARALKDDIKLFPTFREIYLFSAVVGFVNGLKDTTDTSEKVQSASIFASDLNKKKPDLRFLYRIMMLTDNDGALSVDDLMNRAFRDDANEEDRTSLKTNMQLFNSYVCGGLDHLYNRFKDYDDYSKMIDALYDYIHEYAIMIGIGLSDTELPDFSPEF